MVICRNNNLVETWGKMTMMTTGICGSCKLLLIKRIARSLIKEKAKIPSPLQLRAIKKPVSKLIGNASSFLSKSKCSCN